VFRPPRFIAGFCLEDYVWDLFFLKGNMSMEEHRFLRVGKRWQLQVREKFFLFGWGDWISFSSAVTNIGVPLEYDSVEQGINANRRYFRQGEVVAIVDFKTV